MVRGQPLIGGDNLGSGSAVARGSLGGSVAQIDFRGPRVTGIKEPPSQGTVEGDTTLAIAAIRQAIGQMLAQLPGQLRRAVDLQRCLGIDYKLCWQMFEVVKGDDPLVSGRHLPSMVSVRKFTAAAVKKGASRELADALHEAAERFHDVVRTHAADRASFNTILAAVNRTDDTDLVSAQNRRSAFRIESQIWGAQVGINFSSRLVRRSPVDPNGSDSCGVTLKVDFQRIRPEVQPVVFGQLGFDVSGFPVPRDWRPLDAESYQLHGAPVLPEFSSNPLPRCKIVRTKDGWVRHILDTDVLGRMGLVDLAYGTYTDNAPLTDVPERGYRMYHRSIVFSVPTERSIQELLVHRPSMGTVEPRCRVFAGQSGDFIGQMLAEQSQFLVPEKVVPLGRADRVVPPPGVKNYFPMLTYACESAGWDPREFDVYRCTIDYPILQTTAALWFPVPEP